MDGQAARNVIAWDSFSIGQGNSVTFGGTYDYLNYVKGNSLSEIYGSMSGGGNIYLVNPNGIIFGESASINVGSLYASTRNMTEADLAAFAETGELGGVVSPGGNIVNRMESDLKNMNITLEGDTVSFAKSKLTVDEETGEVTAVTLDGYEGDGAANYKVIANNLDIGYSGEVEPAAGTAVTNLTAGGLSPVYCQLIDRWGDMTYADGNYMLAGNVAALADSIGDLKKRNENRFMPFHGVLDGAGHRVDFGENGKPLFKYIGVYELKLPTPIPGVDP